MKWLSYISFCLLLLPGACKSAKVSQIDALAVKVNTHSGIDSSLYHLLQDYKITLDEKMNQVIAYTDEDLIRDQPSSNLGNMMADIIYHFYKGNDSVDMAIMNQGGIRVPSISKGPVSVRDAYQLMPFDNEIVQLEIPGSILQQLLEHAVKQGGWPISHAEIIINTSNQITHIYINHQLIDPERTYTIATNDYIANGGDQCHFLVGLPLQKSGKLLREAIMDAWSAQNKGISIDNHKRIRYEQ